MKHLVKKHPELVSFYLGQENSWQESKCSHNGLNCLLSLPNLSSLSVERRVKTKPKNVFKIKSNQLQTIFLSGGFSEKYITSLLETCKERLQHLKISNMVEMTDSFMVKSLQICGSTLISLDMSNSNATGENLSEVKGQLLYLENLHLRSFTQLNDSGLLQILKLCGKSLRVLNISFSSISGENLFEYPGSMLVDLTLSHCSQLSDQGLIQIFKLCGRTLKHLNLSFSNITGERILHCSETPLVVENLDLTECKQITNKGLLQILQLCGNTLKSLSLQGTRATGENLAHLKGGLPRLEILNLMSCKQLTDAGLLVILHLSKHSLRSLNLGHTDITGDNLAAYNIDLSCLEILNLESCNNLTDKGFQLFLQIIGKSVKSLNLVHTNITGEYIPEYDEALPCLEKLNLTYCNQLTDRGLRKTLERCRDSLEYLELGWTGITGENMTEFTGTLHRVEYLNLTCCQHLTNRGLGQMLNLCCRRLKSLNLVKTKISGENLTGLEGYLPCLESLNLSNCPRLTDQGLICFLRMCGSTLTTLSMGGTHFTGEHFKDFNQTLPLLKSLSLIGCGKLTPNGLLYLLKLCERSKLRYLYLAHCTKLSGYFRHKVQRLYLGVKVYY